MSLAVAESIYTKLENQNIVDAYEDVFKQQEALSIIEPIEKRVPGQTWIPHRPVIHVDEHTVLPLRLVFNCSLKIGKSPLNEAAFLGVDVMNNLLYLLLYFRTNDKCVPYWYKTVIFRFVSSPFILNYIIQHHFFRLILKTKWLP